MTSVEMYCPKDFNLGDYRDDHCNVGGIPCPEPKPVDPEQVVQVSCGPCGRFWGIPIDKIMKGKAQAFHSCALSECAAKIIVPPTPEPVVKEVPTSISVEDQAKIDAFPSLKAASDELAVLIEAGKAPSPDLSSLSYGQGEATPAAPTPAPKSAKTAKPRK